MKLIKVYDDTGEPLEEFECKDFNLQYTDTEGHMHTVRKIENAVFGLKLRIRNDYYKPIAAKLVEKFDELSHIRLKRMFFIEDGNWEPKNNKRTWIARVYKANAWLYNTWGYDYVMEFREYLTDKLSVEQIVALVYHELLHIGIDGEIRPHDIEDWNHMVATLGSNWTEENCKIINILEDDFDWDYLRRSRGQLNLFDFNARHDAQIEAAAKTSVI